MLDWFPANHWRTCASEAGCCSNCFQLTRGALVPSSRGTSGDSPSLSASRAVSNALGRIGECEPLFVSPTRQSNGSGLPLFMVESQFLSLRCSQESPVRG